MRRLAVVLLVSLAACGDGAPQRYQGYVEGEALRLAAGGAGRVDALHVRRGDTVEAGTALFAIDAAAERAALAEAQARHAAAQARLADLGKGGRVEELEVIRARLTQAVAQLELARTQLQRQRALHAREAVSREQLDQAETAAARDAARVRELEASLKTAELAGRTDALRAAEDEVRAAAAVAERAQWSLGQKTIAAPTAGAIEDIYYRRGEWVAAGTPVLALLPPQNRRLRFFVPEPVLGRLRVGQDLRVFCDGCAVPIGATVRFISSNAEYTPPVIFSRERRTHLVYRIEAEPAAEDALRLHPGQPVDVELLP